jgi:putative flippase GtrA
VKTTTRYLLVGLWNSVFGVGIFLILSQSFPKLSDSLILLIAYVVSIVQAHFMQRKFVWSSEERYFQELVRFSGAYISQFVANLVLLQIFVRFVGLNRSVSQVIIVLILTVVMYFVNKNGVFRAK